MVKPGRVRVAMSLAGRRPTQRESLAFEGIATLTVVALAPDSRRNPTQRSARNRDRWNRLGPVARKTARTGGPQRANPRHGSQAHPRRAKSSSKSSTRSTRRTRSGRRSTQTARFRRRPGFPKQLKYRLTVRAILKDVASSAWICPATSGSRFPDLVVERSKLGLDTRFFGKEVVALVDGRPILASEILERAYPEPLPPQGLSLLMAAKGLQNDRVTEADYRALQETAIRKYAADYARTRMLGRAYEVNSG